MSHNERAKVLAKRCLANGNNITIVGDDKDDNYLNGIDKTVFVDYIKNHNGNIYYCNIHDHLYDLRLDWSEVYLIGSWDELIFDALDQISWTQMTIINPLPKHIPNNDGTKSIIEHHNGSKIKNNKLLENHNGYPTSLFLFGLTDLAPYADQFYRVHQPIINHVTVEDCVKQFNRKLDDGKIILVDDCMENLRFHQINKIRLIADRLKDQNPRRVFYISGSLDARTTYNNYIKENNYRDFMTVIETNILLYLMRTDEIVNLDKPIEYNIKLKTKKFVCFNKVHKGHRAYILAKMLESGTFNKAYFSFEGGTDNWLDNIKDNYRWSRTIVEQFNKHKNKFPIRLNITDDRPNPFSLQDDDLIYHENSYFSVVTETIFYKDGQNRCQMYDHLGGMFFTEKTARPIVLKHPFIMVNRQGALATLRALGFKTFHPFINESYDLEEDDDKRLDMIVAEIERLSAFSDKEWITWQTHIKDIVEHNFTTVMNEQRICRTQNVVKLFKENKL